MVGFMAGFMVWFMVLLGRLMLLVGRLIVLMERFVMSTRAQMLKQRGCPNSRGPVAL